MSATEPELNSKMLREFGFLTGAIFAALFGLLFPWVFEKGYPVWPWIVAAVLWMPALLVPMCLKPVYKVWMFFGGILGWINTRIILGVLFYLIVMPMGVMMRLFGKDPMARKLLSQLSSYRVLSKHQEKQHMERPF